MLPVDWILPSPFDVDSLHMGITIETELEMIFRILPFYSIFSLLCRGFCLDLQRIALKRGQSVSRMEEFGFCHKQD